MWRIFLKIVVALFALLLVFALFVADGLFPQHQAGNSYGYAACGQGNKDPDNRQGHLINPDKFRPKLT